MFCLLWRLVFFFFNDTATTEIYTLSLHDALPIYSGLVKLELDCGWASVAGQDPVAYLTKYPERCSLLHIKDFRKRSEEHTSELQSQSNLVCRLLLEKKKNTKKHNTHIYKLKTTSN